MKKVVAVLLLITTLLSCCGCVPISILGPLTEKLIGEQIIAVFRNPPGMALMVELPAGFLQVFDIVNTYLGAEVDFSHS